MSAVYLARHIKEQRALDQQEKDRRIANAVVCGVVVFILTVIVTVLVVSGAGKP